VKALRVPVTALKTGEMILDEEASNYVLRVHRVALGMPVILFEPHRALEAEGQLKEVRGKRAVCDVLNVYSSTAIPKWPLVLIQAYAKGDKVERIIKDATALGVTEIAVVTTERSVVQIRAEEVEHRRERLERIAIEAARQCGRGDVPKINGPVALAEYLKNSEALPKERLVLSPFGEWRMSDWMRRTDVGPLALFIGPEGGTSELELSNLRANLFREVSFGEFVLRTEVAATSVLGSIVVWQQK
jgi:16S rRNA (uracil1498-N3)-methyltransferase